MTDFPVRKNTGVTNLDFSGVNVTGLPGGGGGVTSINGDPTPAQVLAQSYGIGIKDNGGGQHTIEVLRAAGVLVNGALGFDGTGGLQIEAAPPLFIDSTTPPFGGTGNLVCLSQFGIQVDPGSNPGALSLDGTYTALRYSSLEIEGIANNNDVSFQLPGPPSYYCAHLQTAGPIAIDYGITGFNYPFTDGRTLVLYFENKSGFNCTFRNLNVGSLAKNQIATRTNADITVGPHTITQFLYDTLDQKWKIVS
jgi:hypothetical protein